MKRLLRCAAPLNRRRCRITNYLMYSPTGASIGTAGVGNWVSRDCTTAAATLVGQVAGVCLYSSPPRRLTTHEPLQASTQSRTDQVISSTPPTALQQSTLLFCLLPFPLSYFFPLPPRAHTIIHTRLLLRLPPTLSTAVFVTINSTASSLSPHSFFYIPKPLHPSSSVNFNRNGHPPQDCHLERSRARCRRRRPGRPHPAMWQYVISYPHSACLRATAYMNSHHLHPGY